MHQVDQQNNYNAQHQQKQQIDVIERWVSSFVETTNKRLEENANKLDMLVELTKHMAILQEKQDHNTDHIKDLEKKHTEEIKKIEERNVKSDIEKARTVERLHKRIDELEAALDKSCSGVSTKASETNKAIRSDIDDLEDKVDDINDDYKAKVNFFRGIFFAFAMFTAVGQGMLYKYFADIEKNISESRVAIQKLENRFNETERQIDMIQNIVRTLKNK
jgi:archaellum component FlaC